MNWRVVGAVVLAGAILLCVQSFRVHRLKADLQDAKAETLQAQIQATLSDKVRVITETLHERETIIERKADDAADQIASRSDGRDPLPAGLRDALLRDLGVFRGSEAGAGDPGSGDPPRGVPAAES